jgi:phosphatidylglycerophosphate synthase
MVVRRAVSIVVPRHEGDALGWPDSRKPVSGLRDLGVEAHVCEIAGHRDVVGCARDEVVDHARGDLGAIALAAARVIREPAEHALRVQLAEVGEPHARRMQIGDVSEPEQRGDPRAMRAYDTHAPRDVVGNEAPRAGSVGEEEERMSGSAPAARSVLVISSANAAVAELFAQRSDDRLVRTFARLGAQPVITGAEDAAKAARPGGLALLVRGDAVVDERVAKALLESGELLLVAHEAGRALPSAVAIAGARAGEAVAWLAGGAAPAELASFAASELVPAYTSELRKLAPPLLRIAAPGNSVAIERALFDASYKGVTDFVTKYAWPPLAFRAVKACARLGITPNVVTLVSWALVVYATIAFARGDFGFGLAAAWAMTFLDTVDGKLARVTQNSSPFGHWLDHGLDLSHPPVWWGAWALGIGMSLASPAALVVVGGYLAGRLIEGIFILVCGFETHSWRPLDSFFRLITARRNPNLVLLTAGTLAGAPALGFAALAWWTALSIGFHLVRLAQALVSRQLGRAPRPWEEQAALAGLAKSAAR